MWLELAARPRTVCSAGAGDFANCASSYLQGEQVQVLPLGLSASGHYSMNGCGALFLLANNTFSPVAFHSMVAD
jgi:hypothetical protein